MKKLMLLAVVLVAAVLFAGCGKDEGGAPIVKLPGVSKNVATVDGLNITSKEYQTYLHDNFGEQALSSLISDKILEKWAIDLDAAPTKEDIDKFTAQFKDSPNYKFQSMQVNPAVLDKQIAKLAKQQAVLANIAKKLAPAKDSEIEKMYKENKEQYQKPARTEYTIVMLGADKKKAEDAAKELSAFSPDDTAFREKLFELRKEDSNISALPNMTEDILETDKAVKDEAVKLKDGEWSKVVKMTPTNPETKEESYCIVCGIKRDKEEKTLDDVRDEISAMVSITNLSKNDKFREDLEKRRTEAEITINIPEYSDLADQFKSPNPSAGGM